ncbi:tetratricopeptide repeat protein [Salinispira pacifica]|uniref:Tetratricopeptide repeat protein n=1 Tax=Salinispira pacifica TaxID=1307761 RepID=V5WK95_9SPIO|nr:tetratricopeptide repeat protein [Salinispira pacifica]AHC16242.1 hypothetical protein L21SP2_2894 [Salinispira pacifica]
MKHVPLCCVALLCLVSSLHADDKSHYLKLLDNQSFEELELHLHDWESRNPDDPEMLIAWFNYYLNMGRTSGMVMEKRDDQPAGSSMAISDPDTGDVIGYMYEQTEYDPEMVGRGISYLNRALELYPDRLDIHFGKIKTLEDLGDYQAESRALQHAIEVSSDIANQWFWSDYEALEDGKAFFIGNIQDYYSHWFNDGGDTAIDAIRSAAETQMKEFPGHPYAYNNMALSHLVKNELEAALPYLLEAETLSPEDYIVINNIARVYYTLGDSESARRYFLRLRDFPDSINQDYVERALESLE